jgi:zona occludens toxin
MSIKIHHGPDGTFKTSGAIKDDILPVIKSGRTLVTNIRGFSKQNAIKVLGRKNVHKNFDVIFVDTECQAGRDKMARFFHWAPKGSFFVIDEVQRIFKPKWTTKDVALLNYVGGTAQAELDDRPEDMDTAWDMQRHYNWDFVFTTTSITKVRSEMKDMAKVAVRHINLGLWRFYKTVEHGTDSRGTTKASQGSIKYFNYVPKKIFALYSSTKTGAFTNSEPRTAFYRDPKVLGLLFCLGMLWSYLLSKSDVKVLGGSDNTVTQTSSDDNKSLSDKTAEIPTKSGGSSVAGTVDNDVSNELYNKTGAIEPFIKETIITGSVFSGSSALSRGYESYYAFSAIYDNKELSFTSMDLMDRGYSVDWITSCKAAITLDKKTEYVYCSLETLVSPDLPVNLKSNNSEFSSS